MKKILTLVLIITLAISLFGCNITKANSTTKKTNKTTIKSTTVETNTTKELEVITPDGDYEELSTSDDVTGTIHERNIKETSKKFLDNGTTEYKIILTESSSQYVVKCPTEFNMFFSEATNVEIDIAEDKEYQEDDKYISIGETNFLKTSGIEYSYSDLKTTGYLIITKGNSIFIIGKDMGLANAIYDLLYVLVNYDQINDKTYTLNKNVKDIAFMEMYIKEVPDIEFAIASNGDLFYNLSVGHRMNVYHDTEYYVDQMSSHSSFRIVPESNIDEHPTWFSNDHHQLCYTAHGDKDEYDALIEYSINSIIEFLKADTAHNVVSVTQQDINVWCTCEECTKLYTKYRTNAASHILYLNDVAKGVKEIIENSEDPLLKGRDVTLEMFAYHKTEVAPTKYNSDGEYEILGAELVLEDNCQVMVAPIGADFMSGINADSNISLKNTFVSWQPVTSQYSAWTYDVYFGNYLVPYNSWNAMQDMVKFLYTLNCNHTFVQGAWNLKQPTNFDKLKSYLYASLQWNCNQDTNDLIDKYFDSVYLDASDVMKQAYLQMRVQLDKQNEDGLDGSVWTSSMSTKYFSKRYLMNQLETFDEAFKIIEKYKDNDPELYQNLYDQINLETIGVRYILINLYLGTFSEQEQTEIINSFINDVDYLNVDRISEGSSMEDFIKTLK